MIVSYAVRLASLSLTVFLLVHSAMGAAVAVAAAAAVRAVDRMRPRNAAHLLLGLRLFPLAAASFVVAACCIPSYLWLEPEAGAERVGWLCLAAAAVSAAMWLVSLGNAALAVRRSLRYRRYCERTGAPVLMLAGVFRPRLVVSRVVKDALSAEQLAAALGHEQAHRRAYDNFKRLLFAATPRLPGFRLLEGAWSRVSEWAADDESTAGDADRSLCLASTLVRMARLRAVPLEVSFVGDGADLARRVDRLLHPRPYSPPRSIWLPVSAVVAAIAPLARVTMQAGTLQATHRLLEHLIR
jgi:hypothetical protein